MGSHQAAKPGSSHVGSVARALELVEVLAEVNREISITELSKRLGWPKSTTYGLLSTLRDYRYVDQSAVTGRYKLGVRFFEVGSIVSRSWDIHTAALRHMRLLNAKLGEMVQLATEDNGEVLYIEKIDSSHMLRIVSEVGGRQPMHCTGLGKALLAYRSPAEVSYIIARKGMEQMTPRTIITLYELEKELEKVRRQGYALDDREVMEGLRCVAAPIFISGGKVKYAVSISGLYGNMQGEKLDLIVAMVKECAANISHAMGYRPQP